MVPGDQHGHVTPTTLEHLDHLVAGETAGGCCPDAKDVVTCAETSILIEGERSERIVEKTVSDVSSQILQ